MKKYAVTCFGLLSVLPLTGCKYIGPPLNLHEQKALRNRAVEAVTRAVQYKPAGSIRAQGIEIMQRHMGAQALPRIRLALSDSEPGVKFAALLALGSLQDQASIEHIRSMANDSDPNLAVAAIYALHRLGDTSYTAKLADYLIDHESSLVRQNAAFVLGVLGEPKAVKLLARAAKDSDEMVQREAIHALAKLGSEEAVQQLTFDASSGLGGRRISAINTLAELERHELVNTFRYKLTDGDYIETRLAGARALGFLGYDDGFAFALEQLEFDSPQKDAGNDTPHAQIVRVRQAAALALGAIGNPRALSALQKHLNDPFDPRLQLTVADAILQILSADDSPFADDQRNQNTP